MPVRLHFHYATKLCYLFCFKHFDSVVDVNNSILKSLKTLTLFRTEVLFSEQPQVSRWPHKYSSADSWLILMLCNDGLSTAHIFNIERYDGAARMVSSAQSRYALDSPGFESR